MSRMASYGSCSTGSSKRRASEKLGQSELTLPITLGVAASALILSRGTWLGLGLVGGAAYWLWQQAETSHRNPEQEGFREMLSQSRQSLSPEAEVTEASEESFPASDAPAWTTSVAGRSVE